MAVITLPWSRPLEGNHIVNVPPAQQRNWAPDRPFIMAGIDVTMPNDGNHANAWYSVVSDYGPTAGASVTTAKFKNAVKATGNNGADYPTMALYGVLGTAEEGWTYDPARRVWWKDMGAGADAPNMDTGAGGNPYVYSPTGQAAPGTGQPRPGRELTISRGSRGRPGRIWYASSAAESAAQDGPHPGIALAGPLVWNTPAWGTPQAVGMPDGIALVTMDDPGDVATVRPALKEAKELVSRAEHGDEGAADTADFLGISYEPPGLIDRTENSIGALLGL